MDLRGRMRSAGFSEAQADAVAAGFEVLSERIDALEKRLTAVEGRMATLEGRMTPLEGRMAAVETRLSVPQWAMGIMAAVQVVILVLLVNLVMGGV